jgi:hypothetical protein
MVLLAANEALRKWLGRQAGGRIVREFDLDVQSDRFESLLFQSVYRGRALSMLFEGITRRIEISGRKFS